MPTYSEVSKEKLKSCHPDLQKVFFQVLADGFDHSILCGERNEKDQKEAVSKGFSKTVFPGSKHNKKPSEAVDALPYPVEWAELEKGDRLAIVRVGLFAGYVLRTAKVLGIELTWGGDWDNDLTVKDQTFHDWPHYQIKEKK